MPTTLVRKRTSAYQSQSGRCFYCGLPMCLNDLSAFSRMQGVSPRQAAVLSCTAEHLHARCDGGTHAQDNIVAACKWCNRLRHARPKPPDAKNYRRYVQSRMRLGKWHRPWAQQLR